ncbi:MAG TPA: type VI secretion protein IcmF/TssM N-terminal domain-containing protein [Planctomycetota bacterium]|nr:type VI secretion protein IcmF/TssM N-terminal domain-containing protein [Planctomycetota bacterium]
MKPTSGSIDLSPSVKIGLAVAGGASLFGVLVLLLHEHTMLLLIVLVGIALIGLLLLGYHYVLQRAKKKKAAPLEQGIKDNSGAVPQNISEPARRASLDSLRRNFETGVEKFKAAGRDLYSLPWYIIVGESGSGKTEAIRHCNISFPAGLQDPLQGSGGTINMNWWFTNHAVILDTAGRMFFQEVESGGGGEWKEFLGLLKRYRPNEPVNGLLLVIPVDSLIKDMAEEIQGKGDKIAQQLDVIQRTLDVRFPVFVVITKCDLVTGFREFFENVNDPHLQHQILGWSNPDPLDTPFNPELVDQHLEKVLDRLKRRRLGLMMDPIQMEEASTRRVDQVDALFASPYSLAKIAPRLRLYMEKIFVAGEWSAKPLFIRGIYFTSAMREGTELDSELAEVLGVPVDRLPEGRVWDKNRAYFLRDLFMEKVFRERGLVTSATNTRRQHRQRKAVVLAAGIVSVIIFLFLTWFGSYSFRRSVGAELSHWQAAENPKLWEDSYWNPLVAVELAGSANFECRDRFKLGGKDKRTVQFHKELFDAVQHKLHVPWVFRFAAVFDRGLDENRRTAQETLLESSVLRPVVDAARTRMIWPESRRKEIPPWSTRGTKALAQLIRIEPNKQDKPPRIDLRPLIDYVLERQKDDPNRQAHELGLEAYEIDKPLIDQIYLAGTTGRGGGTDQSRAAVDAGLKYFLEYLADAITPTDIDASDEFLASLKTECGRLAALLKLRFTLAAFAKAEDSAVNLVGEKQPAMAEPADLDDLHRKIDSLSGALGKLMANVPEEAALGDDSLGVAFDRAKTKVIDLYRQEILDALTPHCLAMIGEGAAAPTTLDASKGLLAKLTAINPGGLDASSKMFRQAGVSILGRICTSLERYPDSASEELKKLDEQLLERITGKAEERNELIMRLRERRDNAPRLAAQLDQHKLLPAIQGKPRACTIRALMYVVVQSQIEQPDGEKEAIRAWEGLSKREMEDQIAKIKNDKAWAEDIIERAMALAPKRAGMQEAATYSKRLLALEKKRRLHESVSLLLTRSAPQTAEQVGAIVADAAAKIVPERPKPKIAMTKMTGGFERKYDPDGVKMILPAYDVLASVLKDTTIDLVDRPKLSAKLDEVVRARDAYLSAYRKYWMETLFGDVEIKLDTWAECRDGFSRPAFEIFRDLNKLSSEANKALEAIGMVAVYKAPDSTVIDACDKVLSNWSKLSSDPVEARRKALASVDFRRGYMPFSRRGQEDFTLLYWNALTQKALDVLAQDAGKSCTEIFQSLKQLSRFPLDRPRAGETALTADDIDKIRPLLAKLKQDDVKLEEGDPRIPLLDAISGKKRAWLANAEILISLLPREGDPPTAAKILVDVEKSQDIASQWPVVQMQQGRDRNRNKAADTRNARKNPELGDMKFPSDEASFRFYTHSDLPEENMLSIVVPGPWSCLLLLHPGEVQGCSWKFLDVSSDGKLWTVSMSIKDSKDANRVFALQVKFDKALPKLSDWPSDDDLSP